MDVISICQEMHWDYYTYFKQPIWFIKIIKEKLKIDQKNDRNRNRNIKNSDKSQGRG